MTNHPTREVWTEMASKDTGGQKRANKATQDADEVEAQEASDVAERKEKLDEDIDAILDEIDEALEENSEEFVRGFVQKGGE
ncbi:MAG: prokaryotic ubiquitin-like protein Pup [Actinomycetota bacterium]|jgi:ubiquitin-like protein Pup|nr:prokaryotic ubiquitin-like protein Pup [Actinomycetota bacterium]